MVEAYRHFFGYGSLVNLATHDYSNPKKASVSGWQREWVYSARRDVSFLSVRKNPAVEIQGVIAEVPNNDWAALDEREAAYNRHMVKDTTIPTQIYVADPEHTTGADQNKPILLSYLDCVVQGFLGQYGQEGVADFFATTTGWDRVVLNDRTKPIYPRSQVLTTAETTLVDSYLSQLSAVVQN